MKPDPPRPEIHPRQPFEWSATANRVEWSGSTPMSRPKAAWIGFIVPVVLVWGGIYLYSFEEGSHNGGEAQGLGTILAVLFFGLPSILLGGVVAAVVFVCTRNKYRAPLNCFECGYSLVGHTSGNCPECGTKTPWLPGPQR